MQRDMALIREILLKMEGHPDGYAPQLQIEGFSENQIFYHVWLLDQADLIKAIETSSIESRSPSAHAVSLKWAGHDFLDAARDDKTWSKAMDKAKAVGGSLTFAILKQLLESILKIQLGL